MLQEVIAMDDATLSAPPTRRRKPTTFPLHLYRRYLQLNTAWRADTRLDPQAVYSKRGLYSVSGRLVAGAELWPVMEAVRRAFDPKSKDHFSLLAYLVWLGCEVGMEVVPRTDGKGSVVVAFDPEHSSVMSAAQVAVRYGMLVTSAEQYHSLTRNAVEREWKAIAFNGEEPDDEDDGD